MWQWLTQHAWWLAILSGVLSLVSALAGFTILVRLPEDHFLRMAENPVGDRSRRPNRLALVILRNLAGIGILLVGVVMALPLIPGPGLILVILGLSLTSFPGKRRLEMKLLRAPLALGLVNWLRSKAGRSPLRLPSPTGHAIS
jgi:hypothetical protein